MSGDPFDVGSISTHHTTNKVTSAQPQAPQVGDIPLPPNPYEDTVDIGDHAVAPTSDSAAALEEAPEESPTSAGVDEFIGNAQQEIDRIRAYLAANPHLPTEVRAFYKRALKQLKLLIKDLQQGQLDIQDHLKLYKKYLIQARNLLEQLQAEAQFQGVLQLQGDARQALRLYDNPGLWEMVTESERQSLEPLFEILREYKEGELGPIDADKLASALNQLRSKLPPVLHRIQGFLEDQMVSEIDNLIEYLEGLRDSVDENATAWYAQVASWNPSYAGIGLGNAQGGTTPYNFNQNTQTPESCDSLTHLIDYLKKLRGKIISGEVSVQDYKAATNKVKNHPAIQGANNDILAGVITKFTYSIIVGSALAAIAGVAGAGAAAVFAEGYTGSAFLGFLGQLEIMGGIFALGTEAVPALGMSLATGEMPFEGETAEDITQEVGWSWGKNIAMVGFFHGLGSGLQALAGATQEAYPVLSSVISSPLVRHPLMYLGMVGFGLGEQTAWEGLQWFSSHGLEGNPGSVWTWSNVGLSAITTIPAYLGLTAAGSVFGPELILSGSSHGSVESASAKSIIDTNIAFIKSKEFQNFMGKESFNGNAWDPANPNAGYAGINILVQPEGSIIKCINGYSNVSFRMTFGGLIESIRIKDPSLSEAARQVLLESARQYNLQKAAEVKNLIADPELPEFLIDLNTMNMGLILTEGPRLEVIEEHNGKIIINNGTDPAFPEASITDVGIKKSGVTEMDLVNSYIQLVQNPSAVNFEYFVELSARAYYGQEAWNKISGNKNGLLVLRNSEPGYENSPLFEIDALLRSKEAIETASAGELDQVEALCGTVGIEMSLESIMRYIPDLYLEMRTQNMDIALVNKLHTIYMTAQGLRLYSESAGEDMVAVEWVNNLTLDEAVFTYYLVFMSEIEADHIQTLPGPAAESSGEKTVPAIINQNQIANEATLPGGVVPLSKTGTDNN